ANPNRCCPTRRALAHLYSLTFFRCHSSDHRPFGGSRSCACHGNRSCLTRGGNRADYIGSGTVRARSTLENENSPQRRKLSGLSFAERQLKTIRFAKEL